MRAIRDIAQQVQIRHGARLPDGMVPDPIAFAEEVAAIVLAESILDRAKPDSGESAIIPEVKRSNDESERRRL